MEVNKNVREREKEKKRKREREKEKKRKREREKERTLNKWALLCECNNNFNGSLPFILSTYSPLH